MHLRNVPSKHGANGSKIAFDYHSSFDLSSAAAAGNTCNPFVCAPTSFEASPPLHPFEADSLLHHISKGIVIPEIKQDLFKGRSVGSSRNLLTNPDLFMIESDNSHDSNPDGISTFRTIFSNGTSNAFSMPFTSHAFEPTPIGPSARMSSPVRSTDDRTFEPIDSAFSAIINDHSVKGSKGPRREISVPLSTPSSHTSKDQVESTFPGTSINDKKRILHFTEYTAKASPKKRSKRNSLIEKAPLYRSYQETQWSENFQDLLNFRERKGHCLVQHTSKDSSSLSRWVKRQRYQYKLKQQKKMSALSDERVQLLEKIGFVWDTHAVVWEEHRLQLKAFQQKHGHCNVPSHFPENPKLSTWVKCQRRQYRKFCKGEGSSMTLERFGKLEKMGFSWQLRGLKESDATG